MDSIHKGDSSYVPMSFYKRSNHSPENQECRATQRREEISSLWGSWWSLEVGGSLGLYHMFPSMPVRFLDRKSVHGNG